MSIEAKRQVIRALWRDKMHVEATALELSPAAVRASFEHIWQPAELLVAELEVFPEGLLRIWQEATRGHLIFTHRASLYVPGVQPWRSGTLESVCYISLADWHQDRGSAMRALFNLFDHLLGSAATAEGLWLSEGGGITPALREVGVRFKQVYALGYGREELDVHTAHDYWAHTLWLYLTEPQRLNILDPLIYRLYHHTLMDEAFWR
jgi:hypothetical protein